MEIETKRLEDSIRTRVEDCETLVRSRITEAYVKDLGKKIQCNIIDAVSTPTPPPRASNQLSSFFFLLLV